MNQKISRKILLLSLTRLPHRLPGSPLVAGVWITLAGLALVFLGGCFLIGVMISGQLPSRSEFIPLLYALATGCFGGAILLLYLGIKKLISIGG